MFKWLKSLFKEKETEKETEKVIVHFKLPDGKQFGIEAIKLNENPFGCKKHPEYSGIGIPKNNCNDCWEYHSKRVRWNK